MALEKGEFHIGDDCLVVLLDLFEHPGKIDIVDAELEGAGVHFGDAEHVSHHSLQAAGFAGKDVETAGLDERVVVAVFDELFEIQAHARERRAEFVGEIADQFSTTLLNPLQSIGHPVKAGS